MLKTELGPFLYAYNTAVATLSLSPAADRGALVKQIGITSPSATDNWIVSVEGKPIMVFRVRTAGQQNVVRDDTNTSTFHTDFFNFCRRWLGMDPSIPIPLGQTMTVASVGGATANVQIQYEEHDNSDLGLQNMNHPQGTEWLIPIYTYLNTGQALPGTFSDDTQVAPSWLQNHMIGVMCTSAWRIQLLAAFFQGLGVNTFSGAANHQSSTRAKHIVKNGVDLFGRVTSTGIPNVGNGSAAGSANTVFGQQLGTFAPFEDSPDPGDNIFNVPITIQNGDTFNVREEITGDLTGTASYEPELGVWIARVTQLPGQ